MQGHVPGRVVGYGLGGGEEAFRLLLACLEGGDVDQGVAVRIPGGGWTWERLNELLNELSLQCFTRIFLFCFGQTLRLSYKGVKDFVLGKQGV